jgi:hypothetical protein
MVEQLRCGDPGPGLRLTFNVLRFTNLYGS